MGAAPRGGWAVPGSSAEAGGMAAAPALSGLVRRCKKGPVPECTPPPPLPPPRSLSLQPRPPPPPPRPRTASSAGTSPGKPGASQDSPGTSVPLQAPAADASSPSALSVMDGIPFTLHPKFESSINPGKRASIPGVATGVTVKSLAEIDREYDYTFVVERAAAARLIS